MDSSWNGGPVGELTATKSQKPSQNFVEGIFDALTSYKRFLLTPFLHTPSINLHHFSKGSRESVFASVSLIALDFLVRKRVKRW